LLAVSVAVVGVLHTIVPDHWASITLIARQRGWSKGETARAALQAEDGDGFAAIGRSHSLELSTTRDSGETPVK
jgi:hypothetical protein